MNTLEIHRKKALGMGVNAAKVIDARSVATAEWVRMKCQFGCRAFGTSHCCPPYTPVPEVTRRTIDCYGKAILLHSKLQNEEERKVFNAAVVRLEIEVFLDGYYKAWSMGSGPCRLCSKCDPTVPCKHGYEARPSMEACGIDVFKTARDNGFRIEVVRTREEEMSIFGVILVE